VASFEHARALLDPLARRREVSPEVFGSYLDALRFSSETLALMGSSRGREAIAAAEAAVGAAERFAREHPSLEQAQFFLGAAEFHLAAALGRDGSMPHWEKAGAVYRALLARSPDDLVRARDVALVEKYIGGRYEGELNYETALVHHARALELDQRRFDRDPANRVAQFDLAIDLSNMAYGEWRGHRLHEAIALYLRSLDMRERLLASDPKDELSAEKVAFVELQIGAVFAEAGNRIRALAHYRRASRQAEAIPTKTIEGTIYDGNAWTGIARLESRSASPACGAWRRAFDLLASVSEQDRRRLEDGNHDSLPSVAGAASALCGYAPAVNWTRKQPAR
jgi:tetratricopeptide (TPR) repeat protein